MGGRLKAAHPPFVEAAEGRLCCGWCVEAAEAADTADAARTAKIIKASVLSPLIPPLPAGNPAGPILKIYLKSIQIIKYP